MYRIVRFFADRYWDAEVVRTGLTEKEAKEHCNDPETSSRTATSPEAQRRTKKYGPWFDGFTKE